MEAGCAGALMGTASTARIVISPTRMWNKINRSAVHHAPTCISRTELLRFALQNLGECPINDVLECNECSLGIVFNGRY